METVEKAYAKLNLSLDVIKKLPSGYHEIDFVMQEIKLYDVIKLKKVDKGIRLISSIGICPTKENLAYKAAEVIIKKFKLKKGVEITIEKNIPVGAGLGGGSSDAAALIKGMKKLFNIKMSEEEMVETAAMIGMDVPFFILGGTVHATGRGEKIKGIEPLPKDVYFVLAKPNFNISTRDAYNNLDYEKISKERKTAQMLKAIKEQNIEKIAENMHNDFECSICKKYPIISEIKEKMIKNKALNALMSGSGPTVFGITREEAVAENIQDSLKKDPYFKKNLNFVCITQTR